MFMTVDRTSAGIGMDKLDCCLAASMHMFLFTRATHSIARYMLYGNVAGCLSHAGIGIKTAESILQLFRPSESPFILVSYDILRRYPIPSAGALNTPGWEKLAIFDGNLRLSRKRCDRAR